MSFALTASHRSAILDRLPDVTVQLQATAAAVAPALDASLFRRLGAAVERMGTTLAAVRQDHRRGLGPALYAMGGLSAVVDDVRWALELAGRADDGRGLGRAVAAVAGALTDLAVLAMGLPLPLQP